MKQYKYQVLCIAGAAVVMSSVGFFMAMVMPLVISYPLSFVLGIALGSLAIMVGNELDDRAWHRHMHKEFDDELE